MVSDLRVIQILNDENILIQDENAAYLKYYVDKITTELETLKSLIYNYSSLEYIKNEFKKLERSLENE